MKDDTLDAVEKALGKPVLGDLPENALKVRRNLIAFGIISIVVILGNIHIDPTSSVLGFKFIGVSDHLVLVALLITITYLLIHFAWYAFEGLLEWRLRVTGTRLAFLTGSTWGSEHADYPSDPRQSTLYTWWLDDARRIGSFKSTTDEITTRLIELEVRINSFKDEYSNIRAAGVCNLLNETKQVVEKLRGQVETTEKTLLAQRISCSLQRFDSWFKLFLKTQNLRWLLIDILMPLVIGCYAIGLLILQLIRT